jgi:hypothetical protein
MLRAGQAEKLRFERQEFPDRHSGYLSLWESLKSSVTRGLLAVTVVEHDGLTTDATFPYLPMGNDGRAREGRSR